MKRTLCCLLFGLLPAAAAAGFEGDPSALTDCERRNRPLVMADVTGETLSGLVHGSLVVHSGGAASVASRNGDVRTEFVGPDVALRLRNVLVRAGATTLCDQGDATDVPLTTLTVVGDGPGARAFTFSYWHASDEYAEVQATLDDFLARHFPGFSIH